MNRSTLKRLETLERQAPKDTGKSHTSPEWTEGDTLMVIRLVGPDPDQADARLSTAAPELGWR